MTCEHWKNCRTCPSPALADGLRAQEDRQRERAEKAEARAAELEVKSRALLDALSRPWPALDAAISFADAVHPGVMAWLAAPSVSAVSSAVSSPCDACKRSVPVGPKANDATKRLLCVDCAAAKLRADRLAQAQRGDFVSNEEIERNIAEKIIAEQRPSDEKPEHGETFETAVRETFKHWNKSDSKVHGLREGHVGEIVALFWQHRTTQESPPRDCDRAEPEHRSGVCIGCGEQAWIFRCLPCSDREIREDLDRQAAEGPETPESEFVRACRRVILAIPTSSAARLPEHAIRALTAMSSLLPDPPACRRCSECRGESHHWIEHCDDPADVVGEPFVGYVCKHCEAHAEMCDACNGAVELGHVCDFGEDGLRVCPGCHAVGGERCAPGCIDAEIAEAQHEQYDLGPDDDPESDGKGGAKT